MNGSLPEGNAGFKMLTEKSKPVQVADWVKGVVQRLDETEDPYTA
jgi:hypothetical protein